MLKLGSRLGRPNWSHQAVQEVHAEPHSGFSEASSSESGPDSDHEDSGRVRVDVNVLCGLCVVYTYTYTYVRARAICPEGACAWRACA